MIQPVDGSPDAKLPVEGVRIFDEPVRRVLQRKLINPDGHYGLNLRGVCDEAILSVNKYIMQSAVFLLC